MKRVVSGLLMAVAMSATAIAASKEPTAQVVIACSCQYARWVCEAFWWALC